MPPTGFLYKCGDASNQGERQPLTSKNHQAMQFKEQVATPLQLPLLNQIWDSLLSMKDAAVSRPAQGHQKCDRSTFSGVAQVH